MIHETSPNLPSLARFVCTKWAPNTA